MPEPILPTPSVFPILQSNRVSPQTRAVLERRLVQTAYAPRFFSAQDFQFVTVLAEVVLPQDVSGTHVPFAALIDQRLSAGEGSGWRYAALPPDQETYPAALEVLRRELKDIGEGLARESREKILAVLHGVEAKALDTEELPLSLWFESFKVELIRNWLASSEAMELISYDGFADELLSPQVPAVGTAGAR